MKVAIDLDEVLGDFIREFLFWRNNQYGGDWKWEDVVDYHWSNFMGITNEQAVREVHEFFKTEKYANLPVLSGAQDAVAKLAGEHELYLITARPNVVKDTTQRWLDKNFPNVFRDVVFANHYAIDASEVHEKGALCKKLGCQVIIDDNAHHVESILQHGIKLVIFNKPWNLHYRLPSLIVRVDNWLEAVEEIKKLEVSQNHV